MRKLNVVHVISALPVGGAERNLLRVLPRLDREQFNVRLVTTRERGELADEMEAAGVPVDLVHLRTRYDPASLWRLRGYMKQHAADIVHCHMRRANTAGRIAAVLAGVPIRLAHERDQGLGKNTKHYLVDRLLGHFTDLILTVTKGVAEHQRVRSHLPAEKFRPVYNGLELEKFARLADRNEARAFFKVATDAKVVGCVGRLHEIKNVDQVIRALAQPQLRDVILLLVGDGREREMLEKLSREMQVDDRVVFAGFCEDLQKIYAALDVSVLASSSEGIANVQLEALAAGVPLVTTPVGIAEEALELGRHYIGVDSADPEKLAVGIAEALLPERADSLRTEGKKAIAGFSIEAQARNIGDIYRELARQHGLIEI
jgi:glycosyltransferase involved in cell wall biosynthesis